MKLLENLRTLAPLLIGLALGAAGAKLFSDSMPGAEGSPVEQRNKLEIELKKANNRIAALEAAASSQHGSRGREAAGPVRTLADGTRRIAEDIRAGRPVSPEDIYRASKPLIRDLAPLFDRMRLKQLQEAVDAKAGELARKFDLTPSQEAALKQWFEQSAERENQRWSDLVASDSTRLVDIMQASRDVRPDEGLDQFMSGLLAPDKYAAYEAERISERVERIQQRADMSVQRIDAVVDLNETQRDQIFAIMARSSPDYDPAMQLEGPQGAIGYTPGGDPQTAMLSVLNAQQRATYEAERAKRREEAAREAAAIGLALPEDWRMWDGQY